MAEQHQTLKGDYNKLQGNYNKLQEDYTALEATVRELKAAFKLYENAHTPSSKQRRRSNTPGSADSDEPESDDDADQDEEPDARADGGTATSGRNEGHEPAWRTVPDPDEEIQVTRQHCPCCGEPLGDPITVIARIIEDIPEPPAVKTTQYNVHRYLCAGCEETVDATNPECPPEGGFGVNLLAQLAYARFVCRLPYRKIAQYLEEVFGVSLSAGACCIALQRVARWLRPEYEQIRDQIGDASTVHVDETGMSLDGDQGWIWTFKSDTATLYTVRESRGKQVLESVLGEAFDGTIVSDGWSAYPAFTDAFQRCWACSIENAIRRWI